MASKGYPGAYEKGSIIKNLEEAQTVASGVKVYHAGTDIDSEGNIVATGGDFTRRDIGLRALLWSWFTHQRHFLLWRLNNKSASLEWFSG